MSQLTQMLGLTVQNFLSAATGMAVARMIAARLAGVTSPAFSRFAAMSPKSAGATAR